MNEINRSLSYLKNNKDTQYEYEEVVKYLKQRFEKHFATVFKAIPTRDNENTYWALKGRAAECRELLSLFENPDKEV